MNYFGTKENNQIITCTVRDVLKNAIKVSPDNSEKNLLITIKKSHLAKKIEDCRPEIFRRGDRISAMIINLKKSLRKRFPVSENPRPYPESCPVGAVGSMFYRPESHILHARVAQSCSAARAA